jgi:hypothetical protein
MNLVDLQFLQQVAGLCEFFGLGQMRDVAGVQHEGRRRLQCVHIGHRPAQGANHIGIGFLVEADMGVGNLYEGEVSGLGGGFASPIRPIERGTPPETVHRMPAPAQAMQPSAARRLTSRRVPSVPSAASSAVGAIV